MPPTGPTKKVLCQKWEESERGWGTRPDGYSLHASEAHLKRYIEAYWKTMPDGPAPDEYSRPCGTPYWCDAPPESAQKIASCDGVRFWENSYPGPGGSDGWRPHRAD